MDPDRRRDGRHRPGEPDRPQRESVVGVLRRHRRGARHRRRQQHDRHPRRRCERDRRRWWRRRILLFGGDDNTVSGNFIGTDTNGTPFATTNGQGVRMLNGSTGNALTHNRISTSDDVGVQLVSGAEHGERQPHRLERLRRDRCEWRGQHDRPREHHHQQPELRRSGCLADGTRITQNAIDDTFGLGIDLVGGANNSQTAPAVTSATGSGATSRFKARWRAPRTAFRLEFFRSQSCNGSGTGRSLLLGAATEHRPCSGNLSFNLAVPASGNGTSSPPLRPIRPGIRRILDVRDAVQPGRCDGGLAAGAGNGCRRRQPERPRHGGLGDLGQRQRRHEHIARADSRKLGANEISSLTNIDPAPSVKLRGLGQFPASSRSSSAGRTARRR